MSDQDQDRCGYLYSDGVVCGDTKEAHSDIQHSFVSERKQLIAELKTIPEPRVTVVRALLFLLEVTGE